MEASSTYLKKSFLRFLVTCLAVPLLLVSPGWVGGVMGQDQKRVYASAEESQVEAKGDVELLGGIASLSLAEALAEVGLDLADLGSVDNSALAVDPPAAAPQTHSTRAAT